MLAGFFLDGFPLDQEHLANVREVEVGIERRMHSMPRVWMRPWSAGATSTTSAASRFSNSHRISRSGVGGLLDLILPRFDGHFIVVKMKEVRDGKDESAVRGGI